MIIFVCILSAITCAAGWILDVNALIYAGAVIMMLLVVYLMTANAVIHRFTGEYATDHEIELLSRDLLKRAIRKK